MLCSVVPDLDSKEPFTVDSCVSHMLSTIFIVSKDRLPAVEYLSSLEGRIPCKIFWNVECRINTNPVTGCLDLLFLSFVNSYLMRME